MDKMTSTPFMTISQAARVTGLSQYYLRNGCKDGSVPHIKSGEKYLVNLPRLLEKLDAAPVRNNSVRGEGEETWFS